MAILGFDGSLNADSRTHLVEWEGREHQMID